MVNEQIVVTAAGLFDCDAFEKNEYENLYTLGRHLKNLSGIDYEDWGLLELATAFKIICSREIGYFVGMLSQDIRTKLLDDADKYEEKINKLTFLFGYKRVVSNHQIKTRRKDMLTVLVKEAKESYEAELAEVREK